MGEGFRARSAGKYVATLGAMLLIALAIVHVNAQEAPRVPPRLVSPTVLLAYDGSGAFGPQTPRTQTDGWQEAIDYCVAHKLDLTVKGGWGGQTAIYHVRDTIRIPASQDFRIDGGVYVLNWEGPPEKDLLRIDSGMDCHFTFGILVYGGTGAALRIRPENPVPIDRVAVFIDSDVRASSIADPSPFTPGERKGGAGVIFDTEKASIAHSDFHFTAILNFATCVKMADGKREMAYTGLEIGHLHTNADRSTLLDVRPNAHENQIHVRIGVDQGAKEVRGVVVSGASNDLNIVSRDGFPKGNDLIFAASAKGNAARLISNRAPDEMVTDNAVDPTNRVSWAGPPMPAHVLPIRPGTFTYTQRLTSALVVVTGAEAVRLLRGSERVALGKSASLPFSLDVGDTIEIVAKRPATLRIVPRT